MSGSLITAVYAALVSFAACVALCPILIPFLTRLKAHQPIRGDGPKTHLAKVGTPTMGGIVIVLALSAAALLFASDDTDSLVIVGVTFAFGLIGFGDDFLKVTKKNSDGLSPKLKLLSQFVVTTLFILYLFRNGYDSKLYSVYIPFSDGFYLDLGILTIPFIFFAVMGFVNGVNLTDGLDGLASGVTALVATFLFFVAYAFNSALVTPMGAAIGALLGFLLFNSHPARVFMGDTGSLALGGFIAATSLILRMPLVAVLVGIVYFVESVSVLLQVGFFKLTKHSPGGGRRLFKKAPFHHHLEGCGIKETKVVAILYITTAIACLIGFVATQKL